MFENFKALLTLMEKDYICSQLEIIEYVFNKHKFYYNKDYFKDFHFKVLFDMRDALKYSRGINNIAMELINEEPVSVKKCMNISSFIEKEIDSRETPKELLNKKRVERLALKNKKKVDKKILIKSSRGNSKSKSR